MKIELERNRNRNSNNSGAHCAIHSMPHCHSDNPLVPTYCPKCVADQLNPSDLSHMDHFARTYGMVWEPQDHLGRLDGNPPAWKVWASYAAPNPPTAAKVGDGSPWKEVAAQLAELAELDALITAVEPIREQYLRQGELKWGGAYTLSELLQLDNLLVSTLKVEGIVDPLRIDALKKACKISVEIDRAIMAREAKEIKDLGGAYNTFLKAAQIDELIAAADSDVIATVADLGEFIEECGAQFTYYDGKERDIVDKTINDYQAYVRRLVEDSTGLDVTLEGIKLQYETALEDTIAGIQTSEVDLEELLSQGDSGENAELDEELAASANDPFEWEDEEDGETW